MFLGALVQGGPVEGGGLQRCIAGHIGAALAGKALQLTGGDGFIGTEVAVVAADEGVFNEKIAFWEKCFYGSGQEEAEGCVNGAGMVTLVIGREHSKVRTLQGSRVLG